MMHLSIHLPSEVFLATDALLVVAEGGSGQFCLKPRHADCVTVLVPGIFQYDNGDGVRRYCALDNGVLVKIGRDVRVSTLRAVAGTSLDELADEVLHAFSRLDEQERKARAAYHALESTLIRRFLDLG